ncbi:MAG: YfhO family protein [Lachnospiraceae bacterium]|nr:YfhO family protein [Lachnospiraceae bacterium]
MIKSISKSKYFPILYTAIFTIILFCILLGLRGFYPFGKGSTMLIDMYSQYVPLLYRFFDVVTGSKNLFYEFQSSGGINLYVETINEVLNPFNYVLLLFGREQIYLAVNILLVLYATAASCSAHFFLIKVWPEHTAFNSLLSICYAFSGYFVYNFQIIKWMIFSVIFPLFLLACLRLARDKKGALYALLLAYQLILSIQLGFMTLLFSLFSGGIWLYCVEKKESRKTFCFSLGCYTLIGLFLSAIVLLPNIAILLSSSRSGANLSYFATFSQHGLNDIFERLFQFCHPVLLATGVFFFTKIKSKKQYIKNLSPTHKFIFIWTTLLCFTALLQPANLLWHMGSYVCFPVRYAYMLLLACICLIKVFAGYKTNTTCMPVVHTSRTYVYGALSVLCLITAVFLLHKNELTIVQAFSSLQISNACPKETLLVSLILLLLFIATIFFLKNKPFQKIGLYLTVCTCCYCYFFMISLPSYYGIRQSNESAFQIMAEQMPQDTNDIDLLERVKYNTSLPRNASLVNCQSSLTGYFSTADQQFQNTFEALGYLTPWVSTIDIGGTCISDYLFRNIIFFPDSASPLTAEGNTPLERQLCILSSLMSCTRDLPLEKSSVFQIRNGNSLTVQHDGSVTLTLTDTTTLYLDAAIANTPVNIYVNEQLIVSETPACPHRLFDLGTYDAGDITIMIKDNNNNAYSFSNMQLGLLNTNNWETLLGQLSCCLPKEAYSINSRTATCSITLFNNEESGTLFIPFGVAKGWRAKNNNVTIPVSPLLNCFIGIKIPAGNNEIEVSFSSPYIQAGTLISVIGLILLIGMTLGNKKVATLSITSVFKPLFVVLFWGGILVIYCLPLLGLIFFLLKKILTFLF